MIRTQIQNLGVFRNHRMDKGHNKYFSQYQETAVRFGKTFVLTADQKDSARTTKSRTSNGSHYFGGTTPTRTSQRGLRSASRRRPSTRGFVRCIYRRLGQVSEGTLVPRGAGGKTRRRNFSSSAMKENTESRSGLRRFALPEELGVGVDREVGPIAGSARDLRTQEHDSIIASTAMIRPETGSDHENVIQEVAKGSCGRKSDSAVVNAS